MSITLRKACPGDAAQLLEYCRTVGGETENLTFGAEGIGLSEEQERAYLEGLWASDRSIYLVAERDGEILGTCAYSGFLRERLAHRGELALSVKKEAWGQHIGTRLLEKALDFAKNTAHAEIVSLEVRSDNARAIALYRRFGFETVGTFPGYMKVGGEHVDCDIMLLKLS